MQPESKLSTATTFPANDFLVPSPLSGSKRKAKAARKISGEVVKAPLSLPVAAEMSEKEESQLDL